MDCEYLFNNASHPTKIYELLAEQNHLDSIRSLATHYKTMKDDQKAFKYYKRLYDSKVDENAIYLAEYYEAGIVVEKDLKKAFEIYQQTQHDYKIGMFYKNGYVVEKDLIKAKEHFIKAETNCDTLYELALLCEDNNEKFKLFNQASELGNLNARYELAMCYKNGIGCEQDNSLCTKIIKELEKKVNSNNSLYKIGNYYESVDKSYKTYAKYIDFNFSDICVELYLKIAYMYQRGKYFSKDINEAKKYYKMAIKYNNANAYYELGEISYNQYNYKDAFEYYQKAVEYGFKNAYYDIGWMYEQGEYVEKDVKKAYEMYCQDSSERRICYNQGRFYYDGLFVDQNYEKAYELLKKAYDMGHNVVHNIAKCYIYGHGTEKNEKLGIELLKKSKCDTDKIHLAEYYINGTGVQKNVVKAFTLYNEHTTSIFALDAFANFSLEYDFLVGDYIEKFCDLDCNYKCLESFIKIFDKYYARIIINNKYFDNIKKLIVDTKNEEYLVTLKNKFNAFLDEYCSDNKFMIKYFELLNEENTKKIYEYLRKRISNNKTLTISLNFAERNKEFVMENFDFFLTSFNKSSEFINIFINHDLVFVLAHADKLKLENFDTINKLLLSNNINNDFTCDICTSTDMIKAIYKCNCKEIRMCVACFITHVEYSRNGNDDEEEDEEPTVKCPYCRDILE